MNVSNIITTVGIPAIIGILIYIGRKVQMLDDMEKTLKTIETDVKIISDILTKK